MFGTSSNGLAPSQNILRSTQAADLAQTGGLQQRNSFTRMRSYHDADDMVKYQETFGQPSLASLTSGYNGGLNTIIKPPIVLGQQTASVGGGLQLPDGFLKTNQIGQQFLTGTPSSNFGLNPIQVTSQGISMGTLNTSTANSANIHAAVSDNPLRGSLSQQLSLGTSLPQNTLNIDGSNPNVFHGKSMRSIQLFNNPTAASPPMLHPSQNPAVQAESPRSKRLGLAQRPSQTSGGFAF